jgi:acetyl esterase/lipase
MSASFQTQAGDLEPEIRHFVDEILEESGKLAAGRTLDLSARRALAETVRAPWTADGPKMRETRDITLPDTGRTLRIHIPRGGAGAGTLLYLHGGGWMLFSLDTHDRLMREYASASGCAVVGIDYSLAPENPFPTALKEIVACMDWLRSNGVHHGLKTSKLLVGGDSAGGNLALAVAKMLRDRRATLPDGVLINYGALDTEHRASHQRYDGSPYMLDVAEMDAFWQAYLNEDELENPYARVMLGQLSGLPATHICIAECDILVDENKELLDRLKTAGVDVTAEIYPGATHSFLEAMSISPIARKAIADSAAWIKRIIAS